MVLNAPESSDSIAKNSLVIPAGGFAFLKIALTDGVNGPLTTLDTDWASLGSGLFAITDPDGAPVSWTTNALDPSDPADDYDAIRSSYVGDQVAPEAVGLHATLSGGLPVRLALKILVPSGAEQTSSNSNRKYKVVWNLKKNGNPVVAEEFFNVGPSGIPTFSDTSITWAEVVVGINSSITDTDQQDAIVSEASEYVKAVLEDCGLCPDDALPDKNRAVRQAMLLYARHLVAFYDASAGKSLKSIKEGAEQLVFAGSDSKTSIHSLQERADAILDKFCKRSAPGRRASFGLVSRRPSGCC